MTHHWSHRQIAIFDWVLAGAGHGVVDATAGSGKTTTILEVCARILTHTPKARILYLVFNKEMKRVAEKKFKARGLGHVEVRTLHAQGRLQLLHGLRVKQRFDRTQKAGKLTRIIREQLRILIPPECWYDEWRLAFKQPSDAPPLARFIAGAKGGQTTPVVRSIRALVEKTMTSALDAGDPDWIEKAHMIARRFHIHYDTVERPSDAGQIQLAHDARPHLLRLAERVQVESYHGCAEGWIDFGDMAYWPGLIGWGPERAYDWVMVDEAQDLYPVLLRLLSTLVPTAEACPPHLSATRLLAVGDPNQAIYGFSGADPEAFERLAVTYQATRLPLDITYRCPTSHVVLCNQIVSRMRAHEDAIKGRLTWIESDQLTKAAAYGDMILCRAKSPLFLAAVRFLAASRPVVLKGRAAELAREIERAAQDANRAFPGVHLGQACRQHIEAKIDTLFAHDPDLDPEDESVVELRDLQECLVALVGALSEPTLDALSKLLKSLTNQRRKKAIFLSTVHRAKGLEFARVFILRPDLLPLRDEVEEWCCVFVAASRAKRELVVVEPAPGRGRQIDPFWFGDLVGESPLERHARLRKLRASLALSRTPPKGRPSTPGLEPGTLSMDRSA